MITVINGTARVLRRRDNILRGVASICTKPFNGTDCCVTISGCVLHMFIL